jgi:Flp pilus assembly pilin Flp
MFVFPFATITDGSVMYKFMACGLRDAASGAYAVKYMVLPALIAVNFLASFVTIFLFKKRMLQLRISVFNAVLLVLLYFVLGGTFYLDFLTEMPLDGFATSYGFSLIIPLVNIILTVLAIRGIGADEALVRSLDRLR